ncbi:MAG: PTS sugar transporter subunit IIA [Clostridium sp.]
MCRRENAATTAFGGIAIPHAVEMDAMKTSIAVAISKNGIQWGPIRCILSFCWR